MAENLRVLASARSLTENLLTDVARRVRQNAAPATYSQARTATKPPAGGARGISVNRAL